MFKDVLPDANLNKRAAVLFIMSTLPDRDADQSAIELAALGCVQTEERECQESVRRLVQLSPNCYGTFRRSGFWGIVSGVLTREEAIKAYLGRFPREITKGQWESLVQYLCEIFEISTDDAGRKLQRFSLRINARNHEPEHRKTLACYA